MFETINQYIFMIYDWIYKQFYDMLYVFICLMMCEEMMNIYIYIHMIRQWFLHSSTWTFAWLYESYLTSNRI